MYSGVSSLYIPINPNTNPWASTHYTGQKKSLNKFLINDFSLCLNSIQ